MKSVILLSAFFLSIALLSCRSDQQSAEKPVADSSMETMGATGPMQESAEDTTKIDSIPAESPYSEQNQKKKRNNQ